MGLERKSTKYNQEPDKVTLVSSRDVGEQKTFICYTNPDKFVESFSASYAEPEVLGLTHQPYQYMSTKNAEFKLDFVVDKLYLQRKAGKVVDVDDFRRFLKAHLYPPGANRIGTPESAPPSICLVWPNVITATVRLMSVTFTHSRFDLNGTSTFFKASCVFKRELTERLTFQTVRNKTF